MADYPQLKTLTIDNVTMGMKEGLGLTYRAENTRTGAVASGTVYDGVSYRLTEKGSYLIRASVYFPEKSTTGSTLHSMSVLGGSDQYAQLIDVDATNASVYKQLLCVINNASNSELIVKIQFSCSKNIPANAGLKTTLFVSRLVRIPA